MSNALVVLVTAVGLLSGGSTSQPDSRNQVAALGAQLAKTICAEASIQVEVVKNSISQTQLARLETRQCEQGRVTTYVGRTASDPSGMLLTVEVIRPRSGLPRHLEIGQSVSVVLKALGPPDSQTKSALTYNLDSESSDTVTVNFTDRRITSVRWDWPVD